MIMKNPRYIKKDKIISRKQQFIIGQIIRDDLTGRYVIIKGFDGDSKSMLLLLDDTKSLKYNNGKRRPWEVTNISNHEKRYYGKI